MADKDQYLIGIDIGTSGLKCVVVKRDGRVLGSALRAYSPLTPRAGWAEQDAETWVAAALEAVSAALQRSGVKRAAVAGIGFSGQMHSLVCLDKHKRCLRPAILWLDQRSMRQVAALQEKVGQEQLAQWIANPLLPGFLLASLLWVQENEPAVWERLAHVLLPKDYVRFRFTGEIGSDYSDASATALLDVGRRAWCGELAAAAGIPGALLPPLYESAALAGYLTPPVAEILRLPPGIPVACGAGDQQAQAVGNGLIRPGLVSCTIGTGGQLFAPIERFQRAPQLRLHTFCHAVPNQWHWQAATLAAGFSLKWLRDEVLGGAYSYQQLADAAAAVPPGAEGLVYLPYLQGERTPHMDPRAQGVFYGLTARHGWQHMSRAVMEGVVFSLLDGLRLMQAMGMPVERVVASGGGTRHPLWLQLQADLFEAEVVHTESEEAAALGAALLAGVGAGVYAGLDEACQSAVRFSPEVYRPRPQATAVYRQQGEIFRALYGALAPIFQRPAPAASLRPDGGGV